MSLENAKPASGKAVKIALVGAGLVAGAIGAATYSASAQVTATASSPGGYSAAAPGPGGPKPIRSDEKAVTGATAATLKAAALKAVPGATLIRVETDAGDGAYEAHVRKSDGTLATVKFDKNLKVTKVESGMGLGDPAPAGHSH